VSHEVKASTAQLRQHGFGRRRYFETLILPARSTAIGCRALLLHVSTFVGRPSLYLEDLFVVPEERGQGGRPHAARCPGPDRIAAAAGA